MQNFAPAVDKFQGAVAAAAASGEGALVEDGVDLETIVCTNIHDFVQIGEGQSNFQHLRKLDILIGSQANLHRAHYTGDTTRLEQAISKRQNTIRGFILHTADDRMVGYAIYYPMIDSEGKRAAYCEDFFITEGYRGKGVAKILFAQLAKSVSDDGADYLQWSTDGRNEPVHGYVSSIGAIKTDIATLSCDLLLDDRHLKALSAADALNNANYLTRPIETHDVDRVRKLGFSRDLIQATGDHDFRGFITFRADDLNTPVAVTPGWTQLSTFQLTEGLTLESPTIAPGVQNRSILLSIAKAAKKKAKALDAKRLRWHISGDRQDIVSVLSGEFKAETDSMLGTPESAFVTYILRNGKLRALADSANPPERAGVIKVHRGSWTGSNGRRRPQP